MSFKLQRILILDLKSIIPINLDILGVYFIQVQVMKIKKDQQDLKENKNKTFIQAFKSKKYKKKNFNFFAEPIMEEEVINLKNSFFIPIEINRFSENNNIIDIYLVFKFLEDYGNEDFDSLKIDFNLISNDIQNQSILNTASYLIDYKNRVFAEYSAINFYDFYFFELNVFFYSFAKEIKIYKKSKESSLNEKISILKLSNLNNNNEIFDIKDIRKIMEKNSKSFENSKLILEKSYKLLDDFLSSNLDIFSEKDISINQPLKTMRIDNIFKNKNTSETFIKNIEKIHQDLNKTQDKILKKIPNFLKSLQKSDKTSKLLQYMKKSYKKNFQTNLTTSTTLKKKKSFEISEEWYNKDLTKAQIPKIKNLPIQNLYIQSQTSLIEKFQQTIYKKNTKKKFKEGKHVFILFHGFYGSIWDLQFVKFHIKLLNPEAILYSVNSIEDKTNGNLIRMFK